METTFTIGNKSFVLDEDKAEEAFAAKRVINGRQTMVQFGNALSLAKMAEEDLGPARSLRKVSRILRVHFQRQRAAAIGPDLSHRRTVVSQVLNSPPVRAAIAPEE